MMSFWGHILGSDFGVILGLFGGFWGQILGSFWASLRSDPSCFWAQIWGLFGVSYGVFVGQFWGQILGSFWASLRSDPSAFVAHFRVHFGVSYGVFGAHFGVSYGVFGGLTLCRSRWGSPLPLGQRRPLGVLQEVVEEQNLLAHLGDFLAVFVEDVLADEFGALRSKVRGSKVRGSKVRMGGGKGGGVTPKKGVGDKGGDGAVTALPPPPP